MHSHPPLSEWDKRLIGSEELTVDFDFLNFLLRRQISYVGEILDMLLYFAFLTIFTWEVFLITPGVYHS